MQESDERDLARTRSDVTWMRMFAISIALLIAVIGFGAGMIAERSLFTPSHTAAWWRDIGGLTTDTAPSGQVSFPRLAEVRQLIEDEYYFRPVDDTDTAAFTAELERNAAAGIAAAAATPAPSLAAYQQQLETAAIQAMTDGLPDDYSIYLEPIAQAPLAEDLRGQYEGIGVWVEQLNGEFIIVSPIPGSPAEAAGLRSGDVIVAADGRPLVSISQDEGMKLIRGPAETTVQLTIRRGDGAAPFDVSVTRQAITVPAVVYQTVANGQIGWIRITIFNDQTTSQLDDAVRRANADGVRGLVLDLRHNGGGWVTAAQETIGRFVPADRGAALYEDLGPGDDDDLESQPIIGGGEEFFSLPMVVLVDEGTASAAEIVAGALRDHDRAHLVGTATFGKGLVQRVHDFDNGASLRLTFARWLTPNRTPIPEDGLQPDVVVVIPDSTPLEQDPQLDRAVELLQADG